MRANRRALTIVEVACVCVCLIAIVASVGAAGGRGRDYSHAAVCRDHLREVGAGFGAYLAANGGVYPPSYVGANNREGDWSLDQYDGSYLYGYVHWSWMIGREYSLADEEFQCPAIPHGGHPRRNPGPNPWDWELGQVDFTGNAVPHERAPQDKQAPRMAYTGSAAIVPRDRFTRNLSGGPRHNVLVNQSSIQFPATTTLITEFSSYSEAITINVGGQYASASFLPLNPFYSLANGYDPYATDGAWFVYEDIYGVPSLIPMSDVANSEGWMGISYGIGNINLMGRHHPGGDAFYDGGANALFVDGSVRSTTAWRSIEERLWGDRFYSVTGDNRVLNYFERFTVDGGD